MEKVRIIKDVQIFKGKVQILCKGDINIGEDSLSRFLENLDGKNVRISIQTKITKKILGPEDNSGDKS